MCLSSDDFSPKRQKIVQQNQKCFFIELMVQAGVNLRQAESMHAFKLNRYQVISMQNMGKDHFEYF